MRILFVNFTRFWGGGEQWTFQLMNELQKRNHTIILLSNFSSKLAEKSLEAGFETHFLNVQKLSFLNPFFLYVVRNKLLKINTDVAFINSTFELKSIGLLLPQSSNRKVVFNRGIPKVIKTSYLKKYLFSKVVTDVVVNSNCVKDSLSNWTNCLRKEPEVVFHGIDPSTQLQAKLTTKNIAIVGRLSHEKGVDFAIHAMKILLKSVPDAQLWVIGSGKDANKLKELSIELGIQNAVVFHGFSKDVEKLMLQCSMLIMTSRWEGFGLVLLEAMRLKMPCLAFDHIAANEIIVDGYSGFLIPNMNLELMANKMVELLENDVLRKQMGANAYRVLEDKFNLKSCIDRYEKIIQA